MDNKKRLVYSIIQYLREEMRFGGLHPDIQESLEAAIQCLRAAFEVTVGDRHLAVSQTLPEMFEVITGEKVTSSQPRHCEPNPLPVEVTMEAERLKTEGNERMKTENFEAAVACYGKAIELNPANAVYFCNRAAAYSKLGDYASALEDSEIAIGIDPYYSKAYGRMGLALSSLKKYKEALVYYKKALRLDPDNDTYKSYLKTAEQNMKEIPSPTETPAGCNIAGLLNSSNFRSVATNLMNNPQIRQIMSGIMSRGHDSLRPERDSCSQNEGPNRIQSDQQFIEQLEQQNPELIEQLRNHIRNWNSNAHNDNQQE